MSSQQYARLADSAPVGTGAQGQGILALGDGRRRGMWSFLTWAFFLSEAFRAEDTFAAAPALTEDEAGPAPPVSTDAPATASLPDDELTLRDWPIEPLPDGTIDSPIRAAFAPPVLASGIEKAIPGDTLSPDPQHGSAVSAGGGGGEIAQSGDLAHAGADLEGKLSLLSIDAGLGTSDGLLIQLGPLSLPLLESVSNVLPDLIPGTVLSDVADQAAAILDSTLDALGSPVQDLLGSAVTLGGVLAFGAPAAEGPSDELFVSGRYSDYHLALRADGPISLDAASGIGQAADLIHVGDEVALADATHNGPGPGGQLLPLPSAIDDLLLRTSTDHLL